MAANPVLRQWDQRFESASLQRGVCKLSVPREIRVRNAFIPYHPGAVCYYREIGVDLPAALASKR
jgi:hypothetical protein